MTRSERRKKQYEEYCKHEAARQQRVVQLSVLHDFCKDCPHCQKQKYYGSPGNFFPECFERLNKYECKLKARGYYKASDHEGFEGFYTAVAPNGLHHLTINGKCPNFVMVSLESERTREII